jgi:hypothetical protein
MLLITGMTVPLLCSSLPPTPGSTALEAIARTGKPRARALAVARPFQSLAP